MIFWVSLKNTLWWQKVDIHTRQTMNQMKTTTKWNKRDTKICLYPYWLWRNLKNMTEKINCPIWTIRWTKSCLLLIISTIELWYYKTQLSNSKNWSKIIEFQNLMMKIALTIIMLKREIFLRARVSNQSSKGTTL